MDEERIRTEEGDGDGKTIFQWGKTNPIKGENATNL